MVQSFVNESDVLIRFGGGRNTRASEDQINPLECTEGENFILDPGNGEFRPRAPFDLVGTAPNAAEIRGFVTLRKTDGSVTMLVQAGAQVYQWDGSSFTVVGSVASSAKLRGRAESRFTLDDKVLIADLNLAEEVHEWDGSTFQQVDFVETDDSAFPDIRAKYIVVDNERAYYGNIYENGSNFPHLLVASQGSNYARIAPAGGTRARPSSSLSFDDPWFLPTPQLKPINGMVAAFDILAISQEDGDFEKLIGNDSTNFELDKLHPDSSAVGVEAVVSTSNDVIYGRSSHIESLLSTDKFGNVEFDDLSFKIADDVESYTDWTLVYNPRVRRIYCFPSGGNEVHVLHTDFLRSDLSPWSKWTTNHPFSFQPTAVMLCRDPVDGLEYVFMGDSSGNVYRLEGTGSGDAGSTDIIANRRSQLYAADLDAQVNSIEGWVRHRKRLANDVNMRFLYAGEHVRDEVITKSLQAVDFDTVYGGGAYYGGNYYYGPAQENRLVNRTFTVPGQSNAFQVELEVTSSNEFALQEVGLRFNQAT